MPSEIACKIERLFAESQLMGPKRRLGDIVDEVMSEQPQGIDQLLAIAAQHSSDPILSNFEQGVREGLAKAEAGKELT